MKLTNSSFGYFKCESEKQQQDLFALLDLLGLNRHPTSYGDDFSSMPWVLIHASANSYFPVNCGASPGNEKGLDFKASDFIRDNFDNI